MFAGSLEFFIGINLESLSILIRPNIFNLLQLNNNLGVVPRHRTSTANISVKDVFGEPNGGQVNRGYETTLGDEDDNNSIRLQPRQNQVSFQGRF